MSFLCKLVYCEKPRYQRLNTRPGLLAQACLTKASPPKPPQASLKASLRPGPGLVQTSPMLAQCSSRSRPGLAPGLAQASPRPRPGLSQASPRPRPELVCLVIAYQAAPRPRPGLAQACPASPSLRQAKPQQETLQPEQPLSAAARTQVIADRKTKKAN